MNLWSFVNEESMVNKLLKNPNTINNNTREKIIAYIKYLKKNNKTKNQIRNEIDEFMINYYSGFIVADWDKKLQRWVNKYSKRDNCTFKKCKTINITKEELVFISNVGDVGAVKSIEIEKVLFCMLVLGKSVYGDMEDKEYWCNYDSKDIFNLARFKYKKSSGIPYMIQRETLIYDIAHYKNKIIDTIGSNIKLLYGAKKYTKEDIALTLDLNESNAENMVLYYLNWKNKKDYYYCKVCGREIKINNNKQDYCNKCAKIIKNEQNKQYYNNNLGK